MSDSNRFYLVDVFADQAWSGNPLAVIVCHDPLDTETMQKIAAEINFSETTFVNAAIEYDGCYPVRVFTPVREIAFTGHPILGTAWIIRQHLQSKPANSVKLKLAVGVVTAEFETNSAGKELVWFNAPAIMLGDKIEAAEIAMPLGLSEDDIMSGREVRVASADTSAILVPLKTLDALNRACLDLDKFAGLAAAGFPPLTYLFCEQTGQPDNDLSARFFFEAQQVREDPATGNGAAFLGAYLHSEGLSDYDFRIEQGHQMGRPSLVRLRSKRQPSGKQIQVGGSVVPTVCGELVT